MLSQFMKSSILSIEPRNLNLSQHHTHAADEAEKQQEEGNPNTYLQANDAM